MLPRSLVRARCKVLVAPAAAAALGDHDRLVRAVEVVDQLARLVVVQQRAHRNLQGGRFACVAGAVGAQPVASPLRLVLRVEAEVDQRIVAQRRRHQDVAAMSAVAAGGAAPGDELLTAEGHAAVAAVAGLDADSCLVNEHFSVSSVLGHALHCSDTDRPPLHGDPFSLDPVAMQWVQTGCLERPASILRLTAC